MKILFTTFFLTIFALNANTQTSLIGKVSDAETGEELIGANIILEQNGVFKAGTITDFNGVFKIDLDPGTYDVIVTMIGYLETRINGIVIKQSQKNTLDLQLDAGIIIDCGFFCPFHYNPPLIEIDNTTSGLIQISQDIQRNPSRNTNELIMNTAGVSSARY